VAQERAPRGPHLEYNNTNNKKHQSNLAISEIAFYSRGGSIRTVDPNPNLLWS